jgi:Phage integrase family
VPLPKIEREEMRFLTPAEIARLADAIRPGYRALVLVGAYGGLRIGELAGLRRSRVDLLRGTVEVAEIVTEVGGRLRVGPPKTRASRRTVGLPRAVVEELAAHLATPAPPDTFVFTAPKGGPLRVIAFRARIWRPATRNAGLDDLRIHDLRHTAVALWIAAGANPKEVAARAGHTSVRHPLATFGSGGLAEGAVAVGGVGGFVVELAAHQAVPQDFQPAVAQGSEGGVVGLAAGALGVIELPGPSPSSAGCRRPIAGRRRPGSGCRPAGWPRPARFCPSGGSRALAGITCQGVRRPELLGMVADLAGDPGGEAVTEPWEAEVDLAARERLPRVVLPWLAGAAVARGAHQQLGHALFPDASLAADGQQLGGGQPDGVGLGPDQPGAGGEVVGGQRLGDAVGEAVGPAVPAGAGEGDQLLAGGAGELIAGWPALQQPQHGWGAQVVASDRQRGREGRDEVLAEPVAQPALIPGRPFVVAGDGPQLAGQLPMGDERPQAGVAVQGQQAGDAGVFGVVFLAGRAAAAGNQVRVDGRTT